jgi:hypothetical protein
MVLAFAAVAAFAFTFGWVTCAIFALGSEGA